MDNDDLGIAVEAAVHGEGWAFERIFRDVAPHVQSYLAISGVADPVGMTNDVFHAVFRHMAEFDGDRASFIRWLFTVARSQLIETGRPGPEVTGVPADPGDGSPAPELLHLLDDAERDVLLLRFVAGLTVDDLTTVLAESVDIIEQLERTALDTLTSALGTG